MKKAAVEVVVEILKRLAEDVVLRVGAQALRVGDNAEVFTRLGLDHFLLGQARLGLAGRWRLGRSRLLLPRNVRARCSLGRFCFRCHGKLPRYFAKIPAKSSAD